MTHLYRTRFAILTIVVAAAVTLSAAPGADAVLPGRSGDIAFSSSYFDRGGAFRNQVIVIDQNGGNPRVIAGCRREFEGAPLIGRCASRPAWSADGRQLAFAGEVNTALRLEVSDADGSNRQLLPRLTDSDTEPAWSPAGEIVFTGRRENRSNLFIVRPDGTNLRQLTFAGGRAAAWSIRNRIAFVRGGRIYTINPDGSRRTRLRRGDEPDFSPSGRRIIYERSVRGLARLFIMRSLRRYRRYTRGEAYQPAWSPGGGTIAFSRPTDPSAPDGSGSGLFRFGLNRTGLRRLVAGGGGSVQSSATGAAWQPLPR